MSELRTSRVGTTAVHVTELGFGGSTIGNLGRPIDDETATAAVDAAWAAGVRYFDTAPHYGLGLSERRLGRALAGHDRTDFVLSTKVGRLLVPNDRPSGSDLVQGGFAVADSLRRVFDYSRDGVLRSLDASLDRLGMDRIDVALIHDPDEPEQAEQAITQAVAALVELRDQGVLGAVGFGMNTWPTLLRAVRESDIDVVMIAGRWTLLDRSAEPLLEECVQRGVSVFAAAPYNSGLLAADWPAESARYNYRTVKSEVLDQARALADRCRIHGVRLPVAAIRYPTRHPAVAAVVVGLRNPDQVAAAAAAFDEQIPEPVWAALASTSESQAQTSTP